MVTKLEARSHEQIARRWRRRARAEWAGDEMPELGEGRRKTEIVLDSERHRFDRRSGTVAWQRGVTIEASTEHRSRVSVC